MSTSTTVQLTLPRCNEGSRSRKIRFIYMVDQTSFRLSECPNKGPIVPLYLGADLFSNTDIRTENHPRYHAKFAKKGLATKIKFSSAFRFHELKVPSTSNSLWFYSIQGLFRVAFELYSKQEQLDVLENFQDVWKSQIHDNPLQMSYNFCVQLDPTLSNSMLYCEDLKVKQVSHFQFAKEMVTVSQVNTGPLDDTSVDHDYCNLPAEDLQREPAPLNSFTLSLRQKLHSLEEKMTCRNQGCKWQPETVFMFLDTIDHYINGKLEENDVTETVLALLEAKHLQSVYSSQLINAISQWLGQQFHAANSSISHQVESFKVQHIERISDLPPAEELVTELFPEAMQTLLLYWMGLSEESSLEKRHSEYPILLLILEFANHNLITGVAHVLYSSLICK